MKNVDKTRVKCLICGHIIQPDGIGTVIWCPCTSVAVDGKYDRWGEGYCRIIGKEENYEVIE